MKFIFAFGLMSVCVHSSIAEIYPLPNEVFPKKPVPNNGECFVNTEIVCAAAGMNVQLDGENCVDCFCNGGGQGVTCCTVVPHPIVKSTDHCDIFLNTDTCTYELTPTLVHGGHACCIVGYEAANLEDRQVLMEVKDKLEKVDV